MTARSTLATSAPSLRSSVVRRGRTWRTAPSAWAIQSPTTGVSASAPASRRVLVVSISTAPRCTAVTAAGGEALVAGERGEGRGPVVVPAEIGAHHP